MRPDYLFARRRLARYAAPAAALVTLTLGGCGGGGDGGGVTNPPVQRADPGPVTLQLTAPAPASRALLVELAGAGVDSVTGPLRVVASASEAGVRRLVLDGPVAAGAVATVWLADRRHLGTVTARVTQAVSEDYTQRDVSGFALALVR